MSTEEDGTTINNEDGKEFSIRKNTNNYSIWRALGKISLFKNWSWGSRGWRFSCILGVFEANFLINIFLIKKACNENLIYFSVIELIQRGHHWRIHLTCWGIFVKKYISILVSFTKWCIEKCKNVFLRSLRHTRNSRGPSTRPWGTS